MEQTTECNICMCECEDLWSAQERHSECIHKICKDCLVKIYECGDYRCPYCRTNIYEFLWEVYYGLNRDLLNDRELANPNHALLRNMRSCSREINDFIYTQECQLDLLFE